jgi:hypothetical protein
MQYISAETWSRIEDLSPDAAAYLNEAELQGELRYLRNVLYPNDWQRARLAGLEHHHKMCDLLAPRCFYDRGWIFWVNWRDCHEPIDGDILRVHGGSLRIRFNCSLDSWQVNESRRIFVRSGVLWVYSNTAFEVAVMNHFFSQVLHETMPEIRLLCLLCFFVGTVSASVTGKPWRLVVAFLAVFVLYLTYHASDIWKGLALWNAEVFSSGPSAP